MAVATALHGAVHAAESGEAETSALDAAALTWMGSPLSAWIMGIFLMGWEYIIHELENEIMELYRDLLYIVSLLYKYLYIIISSISIPFSVDDYNKYLVYGLYGKGYHRYHGNAIFRVKQCHVYQPCFWQYGNHSTYKNMVTGGWFMALFYPY